MNFIKKILPVILVVFTIALLGSSANAEKESVEVNNYLIHAEDEIENGNFDKALEYYDQAIQKYPSFVESYAYKAELLEELKRSDEAISEYEEALKIEPNNITIVLDFMNLYYSHDNFEEAAKLLDKAVALDPKHSIALYNRACVYSILNKKGEAIDSLKESILYDINAKANAMKDTDFENIRTEVAFQALMATNVRLDGQFLELEKAPIEKNGRILLPLRGIFEGLGAKINWNNKTKTIEAVKGNITISLQIGRSVSKVNKETKKLDVPATIVNGSTYVPVRFVSEALGADVKYYSSLKLIDIYTKDADKRSLSKEESEKIITELDKTVDKFVIDGIYRDPYNLESTEAIIFFSVKDISNLEKFKSLDDNIKAKYLNDYAQENWGDVLGCEVVHLNFIFDGRIYYSIDTKYEAASSSLEIKEYKKGLNFNVVVQDREKNTYKYYYSSAQ